MSEWISQLITNEGPDSITALIATASIAACGATNVISNVAAANILIPALACVGPEENYAPLYVLAPVVMSFSMAFLFPIGTPPNAIIMSNGNVTVHTMLRMGILVTILVWTSLILYCLYVIPSIYNIHYIPQSVIDACAED